MISNSKMEVSSTTDLQSKETQADLSPANIKQSDQVHENSGLKLQCNQIIVKPCKDGSQNLSDSSAGVEKATMSNSDYKPKKPVFESGQERLRRHWIEVAGKVKIPERWDQENLLKDWMDCSSFDDLLAPNGLGLAREALVSETRRARPTWLKL